MKEVMDGIAMIMDSLKLELLAYFALRIGINFYVYLRAVPSLKALLR